MKEPQKAVSPDPAVAEPKPEEPKEAPPAPTESSAIGHQWNRVRWLSTEGEYKNPTYLNMQIDSLN